jgi:hypothetical protein
MAALSQIANYTLREHCVKYRTAIYGVLWAEISMGFIMMTDKTLPSRSRAVVLPTAHAAGDCQRCELHVDFYGIKNGATARIKLKLYDECRLAENNSDVRMRS